MELGLIASAVLCLWVGLSLGLLGGGGSILMVPLFVYVAKVPADEAIAMSLLIVGLSSIAGSVRYYRQRLVNQRLVFLFVLPGIVTAFLGGRSAALISPDWLLVMFGGMMLFISAILFYRAPRDAASDGPVICRPKLSISVAVGSVIGFLTGLLGVGGGFLIVPAIAVLMKCSLQTAVGTSLAIIALNSLAGLVGHLSQLSINVPLSLVFLTVTIGGAVLGSRLSDKLRVDLLQKVFAIFIFLVGLVVVVRQLGFWKGDLL